MTGEMFDFYKNSLLGSATGTPICKDYLAEWRACGDDKEKLVTFALRQQCIPFVMHYSFNNQGLTRTYLLEEFKQYINGAYEAKNCDGIQGYTYALNVDYKGIYTQNTDVCAYMYCNDTKVHVPKTKCPSLFVGCKSTIHVDLEGYNSVRIHLYDNSKVVIGNADVESDIMVYRYSNLASVDTSDECLGNVKVFNKDLRLQL